MVRSLLFEAAPGLHRMWVDGTEFQWGKAGEAALRAL